MVTVTHKLHLVTHKSYTLFLQYRLLINHIFHLRFLITLILKSNLLLYIIYL